MTDNLTSKMRQNKAYLEKHTGLKFKSYKTFNGGSHHEADAGFIALEVRCYEENTDRTIIFVHRTDREYPIDEPTLPEAVETLKSYLETVLVACQSIIQAGGTP